MTTSPMKIDMSIDNGIDAQTRKWSSFEELNAWLGERCRALWSEIRHPEYPHFSVAEMLEQERTELMPMPTQ